jgi:hypothetical protein
MEIKNIYMSIESCMHATDLDLDGSWLRESLMSLDEGSPHETPSVDEGIIASMRESLMIIAPRLG